MDRNNRTDYGEAAMCFCILLAFFLFIGEPDVHDAIRAYIEALAERAQGVES